MIKMGLVLIVYLLSRLQFRRQISQTRSKAKDTILMFLHKVVTNISVPPGPISNKQTKLARVEALKSLVEKKEQFLYRLATFDENGNRVRGPHDPYYSPYIRNAIRILFFECRAPYED